MTPADFLGRLKHLVLGHPLMSHPLWCDLDLGHVGVEALRVFSLHYYHHVRWTRLYDAAALAVSPTERIQAALAHILWDEYGCGDASRSHPEQFRRILRALGMDLDAAERTPVLPELRAYRYIHFDLCHPGTPWRALGAVGFAMEWPIPHLYEPLIRGYRRIAGLSNADLVFLLEHIPADEDHSSMVIDALTPHLGSPDVQQEIIEGALASMDARERLVEAIWSRMQRVEARAEEGTAP